MLDPKTLTPGTVVVYPKMDGTTTRMELTMRTLSGWYYQNVTATTHVKTGFMSDSWGVWKKAYVEKHGTNSASVFPRKGEFDWLTS